MKKNRQSPMTSFEELAKSDAVKSMGFDYEKAQEAKKLALFKSTYNQKDKYEDLKRKIRAIDEKRYEYLRWKSYWHFLEGVISIQALQKKVEETFNRLYGKGNNLTPKEEQQHNAACFFNNTHYSTIKEASDEVKVTMVAFEQELKEIKAEKNIKEYSNAVRILKKLSKSSLDDVVQTCKDWGRIANTEEEYHYAMMADKLEDYFDFHYCEKKGITSNYTNLINWLSDMVKRYEN